MSQGQPKVLIIGLDGGSWRLLDRLCNGGQMPNLRRLRDAGAPGILSSTVPPISPVAWTSFLTGLRPGRHRLYGFITSRNTYVEGPRGYAAGRPANASEIGAVPLWEVMNQHGVSTGLLNVPVTYPPRPIQGYIVGDELFTPDEGSEYTYPPDLKGELLAAVPEFRVRPFRYARDRLAFIEEVAHYTREQGRAALWLLQEHPVDLAVHVFTGTDRIQHRFWKYMDPTCPAYGDPMAERFRHALRGFYHSVDEIIGRLVESADSATVFFVSDHGFTLAKRLFMLNRWLHEEAFLSFQSSSSGRMRQGLLRLGLTQERLFGALKRLDVLRLRDRVRLGGGRHALTLEARRGLQSVLAPEVDWSRTRAYGGNIGEPFIYINLAGREPNGVVQPGAEYERLRMDIRERLLALRDPATDKPVMQKVYLREELYSGPYLDEAPDMLFVYRDSSYYTSDAVQTTDVLQPEQAQRGIHERPGILLACGPGIATGPVALQAHLCDVMPTVMVLLGLPVPQGLDGRVLEEIISAEYLKDHPVTYASEVTAPHPSPEHEAYSDQETALIEERLIDLGYL
jgi:predicted AlkP superfamily phosphohydrolase/phosphomutase